MSLNRHAVLGVMGLFMCLATETAAANVVAVVSSKSTLTTLSKSDLADVYLGRLSRFPDGSRIVPIDQAEDTVARDEFYLKVTGKSAAQIKAFWSKIIFTGRGEPPRTVPNGMAMKKLIHDNPQAIGYIDANLLDDSVRVLR